MGIEGVPEAPNPSALSQIIDAVTKSDIFRDMSAKAELASILNELTKAAAGVEQQRMQSLTELGKQDAETERARMQAQSENSSNGAGSGASGTDGPNSSTSTGRTTPFSSQSSTATPYGQGTLTPREASSYYEVNERTASTGEELESGRRSIRDRSGISSGSLRTVTVDLKYGTQDLHGSFTVTCFNRSSGGSDDTDTRNSRNNSSEMDSTSLSVSVPRSWSTVNVVVTIHSLILLNNSLIDSRGASNFQQLIISRSTRESIFDRNETGNSLYEYLIPVSVSEVVSLSDAISRNLVCRFDIHSEDVEVERTRSTGREDEWSFSGNVGFEDKIVLNISGERAQTVSEGESTTIRRTMTISYITPSQPRLTQGREE